MRIMLLAAAAITTAPACGTVNTEPAADATPDDGDDLSFSDVTWSFADSALGTTSLAFATRLVNGGDTPVGPIELELSGDDIDDFLVDGADCEGRTLGRGADCELSIRFSPMQAGGRGATLTARDPAGNTASLALAGRGVRPSALVFEPSVLTIEALPIGTQSSPQRLVLTNTGDAVQTPVVKVTGTELVIAESTCGAALARGESCDVFVTLQPAAGGPRQATLTATGDGDVVALATVDGVGTATVTVATAGTGTVTGPAIDCGTRCTTTVSTATVVLTASPTAPADLGRWSVASCGNELTCEIPVNAATVEISATFRYQLAVTTNRSGSAVRSTAPDAVIDCGTVCSSRYDPGQDVTLTAVPSAGSYFSSWDGCPNPSGQTCVIRMSAHAIVNAIFRPRV